MEPWIGRSCEFLLESWHSATLADYILMVLIVVLTGWFIDRYSTS
jgi:hypothetical protein